MLGPWSHGSGVWTWERDWADLLIANRLEPPTGSDLSAWHSDESFLGGALVSSLEA